MRFPNDARVCFIGDSLTAANEILSRVIDYYQNNFPLANVRFFNCGTSGGTYKSAIDFFPDDVLRHKPTHAVVAFGVNDSNRWALCGVRSEVRFESLKNAFEEYKQNLETYCNMLIKNKIEPVLCTPAPYDEYTQSDEPANRGGYALIFAYAEYVREFARKNGIALCDYHEYMTRALQSDTTPIYSPDHVHPTSHGYYLMAKCFLAHQGYELETETPLPAYLTAWRAAVARLRLIYGAEHMVVRNYDLPIEEKLALIQEKVDKKAWGDPVFEPFIRAYLAEKPFQDALYAEIDALYTRDVMQ